VQVQSLFLAQPGCSNWWCEVMAFAPQLAATLAATAGGAGRHAGPRLLSPIEPGERPRRSPRWPRAPAGLRGGHGRGAAAHREQAFRIGVQVMSGVASAAEAGRAFADLADACIRGLAGGALAEVERIGGAFPGEVAVVALGKCGSREMTAGSDLDLMTLYRAGGRRTRVSAIKGWGAETFYARFTQRLIAALSAPTAEGGLYEVDMRCGPRARQGPGRGQPGGLRGYYAARPRPGSSWR
jgi:glutamate-ammonia-ligase adenylyltransferase